MSYMTKLHLLYGSNRTKAVSLGSAVTPRSSASAAVAGARGARGARGVEVESFSSDHFPYLRVSCSVGW